MAINAIQHIPQWLWSKQPQYDQFPCGKDRPDPVQHMPVMPNLKRKRSIGQVTSAPSPPSTWKRQKPESARDSTKPRAATQEHQPLREDTLSPSTVLSPPAPGQQKASANGIDLSLAPKAAERAQTLDAHLSQPANSTKMDSPSLRDRALQKIIAEIDLAILTKHNEARLIDQEIAKCQISLEQLRRCRVIPYPGIEGSPVTFDQVSDGTGPALEPAKGLVKPPQPAPWHVTDGPYARHYAKWLLPDPTFDPTPFTGHRSSTAGNASLVMGSDGRSARGEMGAAHRRQRTSIGSVTPSQPGPIQPKKEKDLIPQYYTRPDGVRVRLVCKDCRIAVFRSVQGVLNHCRIQHQRNYQSHAAAALDCGIPVSEYEANDTSADPPTPTVCAPDSAQHSMPISRPNVHALITGPRKPQTSKHETAACAPSSLPELAQILRLRAQEPTTTSPIDEAKSTSPNFTSSPQLPSLSALARKRGFNGDLHALVTNAQIKTDMSTISPLVKDDEEERAPSPASFRPSGLQSRALGSVGISQNQSAPMRLAPATSNSRSSSFDALAVDSTPSPMDSTHAMHDTQMTDLSPRTIETNPGLVTDHEDDDDEDEVVDSESESPHPLNASQQHVRIRGEGEDDVLHSDFGVANTEMTTCANSDAPNQASTVSKSNGFVEKPKKKRGRPSKKDKAKTSK